MIRWLCVVSGAGVFAWGYDQSLHCDCVWSCLWWGAASCLGVIVAVAASIDLSPGLATGHEPEVR